MLRSFLESRDVHVADTRLDHEVQVYAVAWNLIPDDGELQGMVGALAQHGNAHRRAFRSLEQIGNVGGAHVVGRLAVDGGDDVARPDSGTIRWCADERGDY